MRATARKAAMVLAGTALALGTLAGCGDGGDGGSSAPDNASKEEFCDAFATLFEDIMAEAVTGDPAEAVDAIKDWAEEMQDVGTPEDMPDEAREGFEVFVDAADDLPDDATLEDLENLGTDLSEEDQEAGDAFGDWAAETCPDAIPGVSDLPSDLASDLPTDLPSELPTELESMMSDFPTDLDPSELESRLSELTASMDAG